MPAIDVIVETPRLVMRAAREGDSALLHECVFADANVMRFLFQGVVLTADQSESFVRAHFTFGAVPTGYAVLIEKPDRVIGYAGLAPCTALGADDLEFGFVMASDAWGRGYAREIGRAQLAFGFETLGCQRLLGLVHPGNAPSIKALTTIGLRYIRDCALADRATRGVYAITRQDWRASNSG